MTQKEAHERPLRVGLISLGCAKNLVDAEIMLGALLRERGVEYVDYPGWEAIDAHERSRGEEQGRPRVKLVTWDELVDTAKRHAGASKLGP